LKAAHRTENGAAFCFFVVNSGVLAGAKGRASGLSSAKSETAVAGETGSARYTGKKVCDVVVAQ
jgi:hypothetical protein